MAEKVGVLNISAQGLKHKSSVWKRLSDKLKSLDISRNALCTLPVEVTHLPKLKTLIISKCNLSSLPDTTPLISLTSLNASANVLHNDGLEQLPTSLVKMDFSFNMLVSFPMEFINLPLLTELNLSNNAIVVLDGIGQLISLVWLVLDGNEISFIPHEIGNLAKLKRISLKDNSIAKKIDDQQSISAELFTHTCAEEISLAGNMLKQDDVLAYDGVEEFVNRRKKNKDKLLQGGGLLDLSLFGLDE